MNYVRSRDAQKQLSRTSLTIMNEAEYRMKNYGDQGGCYMALTDNTLRNLYNSSYDTKAKFNNCFIIHSK